MATDRPYAVYICYDCNKDFLANFINTKIKLFCPLCGDNINTKYQKRLRMKKAVSFKVKWTDKEDKILMELKAKNVDNDKIAKRLKGRTEHGIKNRYKRLRERERNNGNIE